MVSNNEMLRQQCYLLSNNFGLNYHFTLSRNIKYINAESYVLHGIIVIQCKIKNKDKLVLY